MTEETKKEDDSQEDQVKQQVELMLSDLENLNKKRSSTQEELKKQQLELGSKREQLEKGEKELKVLRCELEELNYALNCDQNATKTERANPATAQYNEEAATDKAIKENLKTLEGCVSKPVIDALAGNYTTGFFQQNKMASTHVTVQKLDQAIEHLEDTEERAGCAANFRIGKTTSFRLLWQTSCQYWGANTGQYRLMDQSFNDLVAYDDTIENYIRIVKEMQKSKEVLIYLVYFPHTPKKPHSATLQMIQMGKREGMGGNFHVKLKKKAGVEAALDKITAGLPKYKQVGKKAVDSFTDTSFLRKKPTYHILTFVLAIVYFALATHSLLDKRSMMNNYWYAKMLENVMPLAKMSPEGACTLIQPTSDSLLATSYIWIQNQIQCSLFKKMLSQEADRSFLYKQSIYLLAVRTFNKTCPRDLPSSACPRSPSTNPDDVDQTVLGDGTESWQRYQTAKSSGFPSSIRGELRTYNGNGFMKRLEFPLNASFTAASLAEKFKTLTDVGFFSDRNLAMIIAFTYYVPDPDCWFFTYSVYENTFTGGLLVSPAKAFVFRPHIRETSAEKMFVLTDAIEFVIILGLMAVCVLEVIWSLRGPQKKKLGLVRILKFHNILVLIMFGAMIYVLAATDALKLNTAEIFEGKLDPVDFYRLYQWYHGMVYAEYLAYICIVIFIMRWLKFFSISRELLYLIKKSAFPVLALLSVTFVLTFCFILFLYAIFGNYRYLYRDAITSVLTVLRIFQTGDKLSMFEVSMSSGVGTVLLIFSFLFILCVSFSIPAFVAAVFLDSMRKLRLLKETLEASSRPKDESWGGLKDRLVFWVWGAVDVLKWVLCCKDWNKKSPDVQNKVQPSHSQV